MIVYTHEHTQDKSTGTQIELFDIESEDYKQLYPETGPKQASTDEASFTDMVRYGLKLGIPLAIILRIFVFIQSKFFKSTKSLQKPKTKTDAQKSRKSKDSTSKKPKTKTPFDLF